MFPIAYFPATYYAPRYFPEVGATAAFAPIAIFTLQAGDSRAWTLKASTSTRFTLQAGQSNTWPLKGGD
jgi:hypothetical protein